MARIVIIATTRLTVWDLDGELLLNTVNGDLGLQKKLLVLV